MKSIALKLSTLVLVLAGVTDLSRGYAHTFNVRYAAETIAGIEPIPDSLVVMAAFGMSNFLTGFLFLLVAWKTKSLAPYVLLLIPLSYLIGSIGMQYQDVQLESRFFGRYIMAVYLTVCVFTAAFYFIASAASRKLAKDLAPV